VRLGGTVSLRNPGMVKDGLYDRNYSIGTYNEPAAHVPRVVWAERQSSDTVVLYLDAELDGPGVLYRVIGDPRLVGAGSIEARSALFRTFGEHKTNFTRRTVKSFDIAEGLPVDADGDYRNDADLQTLKKRILRRLMTRRGALAHAPEYGLRVSIKAQSRIGLLRDLQAQAYEQIRAEPGVRDVRVTVSAPHPAIVRLKLQVFARAVSGTTDAVDVIDMDDVDIVIDMDDVDIPIGEEEG
jgi:hypothetical protein